jgi:hypothetical protein
VILHSINYGDITAKKSAAGGVVGFQELGIIYDCEGYGSVEVESGTNLGGVVGESDATLQKCYSQCLITGSGYVGGIAGSGTIVSDSISICTIDADGERIGALIGYLKEDGDIRNNFFANDFYGGVDNINYAQTAQRASYEEIMAMEDVPDGFQQVAVTFKLEDEVLSQKTIAYGSSVPEKSFPDIPEKEGYYVEWDHREDCENVTENLIFTASYIPWTESVASDVCLEEGHATILAVGEFFEDTAMQVSECDGPELAEEEGELLYAYNWELTNEEGQDFADTQLHLYVGKDQIDNAVLMAQVNGTWQKIDAAADGSYLAADVPFGAAVAVVLKPQSRLRYYVAGAAAVVLIGLLWFCRRISRRRRSI